ncbi:MAG: acetyl-CoA carboxylase, biotin carboxylase subunit [Rhodobacteraceae bacterium HLUCCA12]|nr:MAG: acetyl-CoA carboxylase, biotin carboxylase subunit [Rhodobacteraceae bacterium HLUCCA12]
MKRVLIANRGEIAVRVIRACRKAGIESVLAVSAADRESLGALIADDVVCVGPAPSQKSYLNMPALVAAALGKGCDAVHPGYGFLSENAAFARMVADNGLAYIGPPADVIELMGSKVAARECAQQAGLPVPPGTGRILGAAKAEAFAREHGFPVLVKASAGGGGRGMRQVHAMADLAGAVQAAAAEAEAAFGDAAVFVERLVERARHIEVQVFADGQGNVVHMGERECSVQRRYQKLIEEAPSPILQPRERAEICTAAVNLARHVGYVGAGTVEFIYDENQAQFYFLEMNTRIQVEHPVTEMVSGIDLVALQLSVAAGHALGLRQQDIALQGHAIECRINAEDPEHGFRPSPGRLMRWDAPKGAGVRVDSHCFSGYLIAPHYDSLIAKIIVHADDREKAITRMETSLAALRAEGVTTTAPMHRAIMRHNDYRSGAIHTKWIEMEFLPAWRAK